MIEDSNDPIDRIYNARLDAEIEALEKMSRQDFELQGYLKSILRYDPESGLLFWNTARRGINVGDQAGQKPDVSGYSYVMIDGFRCAQHRVIWIIHHGYLPDQIDHINGIKSDNRLANLRDVKSQTNARNQRLPKNNTSGLIGVCWDKATGKWMAHIKVDYKNIALGRHDNLLDAAAARKSAELEYNFHENHGQERICAPQ